MLIIQNETPYGPVISLICVRKMYSDCVKAKLIHGKPKGPKLRSHSIETTKNGVSIILGLNLFAILPIIKPAAPQNKARYITAAIKLKNTTPTLAPELKPIQ